MKIFKEEQRFTQWWLWVLLISLNLLFFYGIYKQLYLKIPFGDNPMPNIMLILFTLGFLLFSIFFFMLKLETKIDESGIYYRFYPIQVSYRKRGWNTIQSVNIIKFRPILDYGGWGIKHNTYTVKGNLGIQIYFSNSKLLIGTQKEQEAKRVLETYEHKVQQL